MAGQGLDVGTGSAVLDGVLDSGEWPATELVTASGVTLRAMADGGYLYVAAQWPDATESIAKSTWTHSAGTWSQSGNEDRIGFIWDMGLNGTDGANCTTMCHGDGLMRTNNGIVDVWHWKSARGAILGYADDKYWDVDDRHSDAGVSAYVDNLPTGLGVPTYMATGDPGVNADFLADDAATLSLFAASVHSSAVAVPFDGNATFGDGDVVPGYVLRTPSGDRASVQTASRWENGMWTVEFRRPYAGTEHDFEVVPGGSVKFTHEIFDNTGGGHPNDGFDATVYTLDFSLVTSAEPPHATVPISLVLDQNYPNPFNPVTRVRLELAQPGPASLEVFDVLGRKVGSLFDGRLPAGEHWFSLDAAGLPSGVYVYVARSGREVRTRTMTLVR